MAPQTPRPLGRAPAEPWRASIPAGTARAVRLHVGQSLRIVNVEGGQVADFIAFNAADMTEALSTVHTLVSIGTLFPTKGHALRTSRRRKMVEITRDDTGRHDMLIAACDPWRYEYDFGVTGHRSCSDNFLEVLRPWSCPMDLNPISNFRTHDLAIEVV